MLKVTDVDTTQGSAGVPGDLNRARMEMEKTRMMEALENMAQSEATFRGNLSAQVSSAKRLLAAHQAVFSKLREVGDLQSELARGCERSLEKFSESQNVAAWALKEVQQLRSENEVLKKRIEANPLDDGLLLEVMKQQEVMEQQRYQEEQAAKAKKQSEEAKILKPTKAKPPREPQGLLRSSSQPLTGASQLPRSASQPLTGASQPLTEVVVTPPKSVESLQTSDVESASAAAPGTGNLKQGSPPTSDGDVGSSATNSGDAYVIRPAEKRSSQGKFSRGLPQLGNWVEEKPEGVTRQVTPLPPPGAPYQMDMVQSAGSPHTGNVSPNAPDMPLQPCPSTATMSSSDSEASVPHRQASNGQARDRPGSMGSMQSFASYGFMSEVGDEKRGTLVASLAVPAAPGSHLSPSGGNRSSIGNVNSPLTGTEEDYENDEDAGGRHSHVPDLPTSKVCNKLSINSNFSDMRASHDTAHFEVNPVWKKTKTSRASKSLRQSLGAKRSARQSELQRELGRGVSLISSNSVGMLSEMDIDDEEGVRYCMARCCKAIIVHPNNYMRTIWDIMSLFLVGYDTISIPLELFEPPPTPFTQGMAWVTRLFWSFDMPLSFMTGFIRSNGSVEMRFHIIAQRYLMTWWALDAALIAIDWFEVFLSVSSTVGFARLGKASRTVRVVRMIRLMRLLRIAQILKGLTERIISDIFLIVCDILKSMAVIMGLAHLCACVWYGIGASGTDKDYSWVASMPNKFAQADLGFRYAASLHWSLSQFSGGMDEIAPKNYGERLFAISIYLLAFVVAAIFVSGLTSSMTRLVIIGSHQSQQLATLRRYLFQQGISNTLCLRIQRNAAYALSERTKYVPEDKIDLLHFVSEPLRVELHFEIYSPVLRVHPFFLRYMEDCPAVMRKVCHSAIQTMQVSHNDVLFSLGEIPSQPKVYFIKTGLLQYVSLSGKEIQVTPKMWACEAALWTNWIHRGQLTAITDCRLYALDCKRFQDIASSFEHHDFDPKKYAAEFVRDLNNCHHTEITDLPFEEELPCQQDARDMDHHHAHSVVMHEPECQVQITRKSNMPTASADEPPPPKSPSRRMSYLQETAWAAHQKRGSVKNGALTGAGVVGAGRSSVRNSFSVMSGMANGLMSGGGKRGGSVLVTGVSPTDATSSAAALSRKSIH